MASARIPQPKQRLLYLAQYAPQRGAKRPALHPTFGIKPLYHYEVFQALLRLGFQVEGSRSVNRLIRGRRDFTYVFALYYHARWNGANVLVSALCEYLGVPYLGARPYSRAVADDKHLTKILACKLGVAVPDWKVYRREHSTLESPSFPGPYLVKPRFGAGSRGINESCIQDSWREIKPQIQAILDTGEDAVLESFVDGVNATVPILGGELPLVLPAVQLDSPKKGALVTNEQKKLLDPSLKRQILDDVENIPSINDCALRLYYDLQPVDYLRADFRIPHQKNLSPRLVDVNICCNLGSHASMAFSAFSTGMTYDALVSHIVKYSLRRQNMRW